MTIKYLDSKRLSGLEVDRTLIQGYDGGSGGGAGAGGAGGIGGGGQSAGEVGTGGIGITSSIAGSSPVEYAGGGGGKFQYHIWNWAGSASHGGGAGSYSIGGNGVDGKGGGGGGSGYNTNGGAGGDGTLILRFDSSIGYSTTGSPTVDTSVTGKIILTYSAGASSFILNSDTDVEYLLIAGGGGGGRDGYSGIRFSNGGGAGGVLQGTSTMTADTYSITVGTGGNGGNGNAWNTTVGQDGIDSTFNGMTSIGGGGGIGHGSGAPYVDTPRDGGSGGGGGLGTSSDVTPTDVQDNSILVETDTSQRYWLSGSTWTNNRCTETISSTSTLGSAADWDTFVGAPNKSNTGLTTCNSWIFDGVDDACSGMANTDFSHASTQVWTVVGWIKPLNVTDSNNTLFGHGGGATGIYRSAMRISTSGQLQAHSVNEGVASTSINTTNTMSIGTWYHVAMIHNGTTHTVYLNAVTGSKGTGTGQSGSDGSGKWCMVSKHDGANHYEFGHVEVDSLCMWDIALTEANITTLYNGGKAITPTVSTNDIIAYWNFSETTGTATNQAV